MSVAALAKPTSPPRSSSLTAQLQDAVGRSQQNKGIELLKRGADPNADGGRLFRRAILRGQVPLVREFLANGAKITSSALESALCSDGDRVTLSTIMLNRGADPNATTFHLPQDEDEDGDPETYTMLMVAADEGKVATASLLIARGAHIDTRLPGDVTALRVAARAGHRNMCCFLLDRHAQIAGAPGDLLQAAVTHNDLPFFERLHTSGALPRPMKWPQELDNLSLAMAQKLVALGAKPDGNGSNEIGSYAPLWLATFKKDLALARFLLDKGAHVDAFILQSAIPERLLSHDEQKRLEEVRRTDPFPDEEFYSQRQKKEDTRLLQLFLERGADPNLVLNRRVEGRITALHVAASANRVGAIRLLLQHGANLESHDSRGRTPLMWALGSRSDSAIPVLLDAGADVKARDDEGMTPLTLLLQSGGGLTIYAPISMTATANDPVLPFVRQLVAHGADVRAQNKAGETALHFAAGRGYVEAAKFLLDQGAMLEVKNERGSTPLAYACLSGQSTTAKLLYEHGADPNVADNKGKTPRQIALEPFTMRVEVAGDCQLTPREQKQNAEMSKALSAPISAGRHQIAALFAEPRPTTP